MTQQFLCQDLVARRQISSILSVIQISVVLCALTAVFPVGHTINQRPRPLHTSAAVQVVISQITEKKTTLKLIYFFNYCNEKLL